MTNELGLGRLPEALAPRVAQTLSMLQSSEPALYADLGGHAWSPRVASMLCVSEYIQGLIERWPEMLADLLQRDGFDAGAGLDTTLTWDADTSEAEFICQLRRLRHRELLGIAARDLLGVATTEVTLRQLSELADVLVGVACDFALARLGAGASLRPPLVLAMGKLGGHELNFSSDIDVIFLHPDDADADHDVYRRHARKVIALLDTRTEDGFVYRVDTRLRPFGASGALSLSLSAFDNYLQTHARGWERYAFVKARCLTGTPDDRARLRESLDRFVYRRYVDYGLFESLRNMKALIEQDVTRRSLEGDIKRGRGGIREIEFIVQALQMIRGGQQRMLRTQQLRPALAELAEGGQLSATVVAELDQAYLFLRELENRLQMWRDGQTHTLPVEALEQQRLALAMEYADWPALRDEIERQRDRVAHHFAELLRPDDAEQEDPQSLGYRLWHRVMDDDDALTQLAAAGVDAPASVIAAIARVHAARSLAQLDRDGRRRLERLMPMAIECAIARPDGGVVLSRIAEIVESIGRRSAYFSLLIENPDALERLVDLCGRSADIARQVAARPLLMDALVDPAALQLGAPGERRQELRRLLREVPADDLEVLIDLLSHFKHAVRFEVSIADLTERLPVMQVSDHLTATAEAIIGEVLAGARAWIRARYGVPVPGGAWADREANFCVVGYGKLGGIELGYDSDLDVVFLYDCGDGDPLTSGPRQIESSVYFARLVQRIVHIMSATTPYGSLYEVDMRLRPSGNAGPLVSSLTAFERYQRESAWTWEHQALLRARPVAGDAQLSEQFVQLRHAILTAPRDESSLRLDIAAMRRRMRTSLLQQQRGEFDLKQGAGGLMDAEFLIQYWLLRFAPQCPELITFSDHMRQVDALSAARVVSDDAARDVQSIYLDYRNALHRLALVGQPRQVPDTEFVPQRERMRALWLEQLGDVDELDA